MKRMLLTIKGHFRPYRSAARPKMMDPTDRNISTNVIPHEIWTLVLPKVTARSERVKLTVKKSKASQDYGKLATMRACWGGIGGTYPGKETNEEEQPLFSRKHGNELEGIGSSVHGRLEGRDSSRGILPCAHLVRMARLHWSFTVADHLFLGNVAYRHDEGFIWSTAKSLAFDRRKLQCPPFICILW
jgi:hypothetical protein